MSDEGALLLAIALLGMSISACEIAKDRQAHITRRLAIEKGYCETGANEFRRCPPEKP